MLLKHSSNVPQSALAIEEVFREAGLPQGVFQTLLIGPGAVEAIIADRRVAGVTLTGLEAAGPPAATAAGKALKKSVLELGGSDPFIVLKDADLPPRPRSHAGRETRTTARAASPPNASSSKSPRRMSSRTFLTKAVGALKVGNPMDRGNHVGPLAREDLVEELERQVTDSVRSSLHADGGKRLDGSGYYFQPTVLANVRPGMPAYHEETFGPVASVIRVKDSEDALRVANDTDFGLGSAIWTADVKRAKELAERVEAGLVFISGMVASDARLPFGGNQTIGFRPRAGVVRDQRVREHPDRVGGPGQVRSSTPAAVRVAKRCAGSTWAAALRRLLPCSRPGVCEPAPSSSHAARRRDPAPGCAPSRAGLQPGPSSSTNQPNSSTSRVIATPSRFHMVRCLG